MIAMDTQMDLDGHDSALTPVEVTVTSLLWKFPAGKSPLFVLKVNEKTLENKQTLIWTKFRGKMSKSGKKTKVVPINVLTSEMENWVFKHMDPTDTLITGEDIIEARQWFTEKVVFSEIYTDDKFQQKLTAYMDDEKKRMEEFKKNKETAPEQKPETDNEPKTDPIIDIATKMRSAGSTEDEIREHLIKEESIAPEHVDEYLET